ncbi:hypothetical protein [uncultured Chryseobacterium sp.]|uniref:hypothetical protein n=1 Tax=uncultured Chryseobacterium sp. TaxID=259322 RepID=UPI0025F2B03E|nr:hypothetical protein [uncultured Chryseobacterium sp.]
MNENVCDYQNLLSAFAILRKFGLLKNKEITDWADAILAKEETSAYFLIEISTTTNTHDLITVLEKNSANANRKIVCRAICGIIYHLLTNKAIELTDSLNVIHEISYEEQLTKDEQFLLYEFSGISLYDLQDTYENFCLYKEDYLKLLSIYKDFALDNYSEWTFIHNRLLLELAGKLEKLKRDHPYR